MNIQYIPYVCVCGKPYVVLCLTAQLQQIISINAGMLTLLTKCSQNFVALVTSQNEHFIILN